jgi:hypothetical protein
VATAPDDYGFLASISNNPNRPGDTSNFNPAFASKLASAIRDARANGLPNAGVASGYRAYDELWNQGRRGPAASFDLGGNSGHSFGLAADVSNIGVPGSATAQKWNQIATAHGLYNPYFNNDPGNTEWNHYQAYPSKDLPPDVKTNLLAAAKTGDFSNVWNVGNQFLGSAVAGGGGSSGGAGASGSYGTTMNSSNVIDTLSHNIAGIESGGAKDPYSVLNPKSGAIGKYQVMPNNVAGWTLAATGQTMTPEEFRASPSAQEAVFRDQMQRSLQLYGPKDAASIWFTGKPYNVAGGAVNDGSTTNANYVARATVGLDGSTFKPGAAVASAAPGTTLNSSPGAPGAAPAQGGLAGGLKSATDATKPFANNTPQPPTQPFNLQPARGSGAAGGPMMLGPGGQNTTGQRLAQNYVAQQLAQQGISTQPMVGANFTPTMGMQTPQGQQPMPSPGAAQGLPSMPGTTLNSPSQLQMAMMTGSLDPYSMYARPPGS